MKTPNLKNAVEMSELSADFEALDHVSRYYLLFPGDYAKVCVEFSDHKGYTGERFGFELLPPSRDNIGESSTTTWSTPRLMDFATAT